MAKSQPAQDMKFFYNNLQTENCKLDMFFYFYHFYNSQNLLWTAVFVFVFLWDRENTGALTFT